MPQTPTKFILAPMAGFSDQPFRRIVRSLGADEVVTELISANALVRRNRKTFDMAALHPDERPASIQIFGSDPAMMAEAARLVEPLCPLFIDINMGCPAKKVTRTGAGAALLEDPVLAGEVVRAVVSAVRVPVSVKIRTGKSRTILTGAEIARRAAGHGAKRITVHARTVADGFSGTIDHASVAALKRELSVEIIGNGGIHTADDAATWLERTGCDGLMIGRGAIGMPSLFRALREGGATNPTEEMATVLRHMELMEQYYGARRAAGPMRGHLIHYSKGLAEARRFRREISAEGSWEGMKGIVERYFGAPAECAAH